MEIVSCNNVYLLHYLPFIFLYLENSKKKTQNKPHQTHTFNSECSCSAVTNKHPPQTHSDTSFNLYIGQAQNTLWPERTSASHPNQVKVNFSYAIPSKADRGALMFCIPLGAAVPALLFQRRNCCSSSQSRSYPFIQFCYCYKSPLAATTLTMKASCPHRGKVFAVKDKHRKEAFYLQHAAVCHLHNRSAVRNNCTNTKVSLS